MQQITGPMAESLQRQRSACNSLFHAARKVGQPIDGEAFLNELATTVEPIVRSVASIFAEKVDAVTLALYGLTLELFTAALLGRDAKFPVVRCAWQELLPLIPKLMARDPERLAGCVTNAVYNLAAVNGAKPDHWINSMKELAPYCANPQLFLDCGKVLAWRAGMAQFRAGAIAVARQMEPELAARALNLPQPPASASAIQNLLDLITENPWLAPNDALTGAVDRNRIRIMRKAGAFRGFGGPFIRPPSVSAGHDQLFVSDGESTWNLLCDIHGVYFHRIASAQPNPAYVADGVALDGKGRIIWHDASNVFDEFIGPFSSIACDGKTLAITLPTSHHVFLLARG